MPTSNRFNHNSILKILVKSRSLERNQTKIKNKNCRPGFIKYVHVGVNNPERPVKKIEATLCGRYKVFQQNIVILLKGQSIENNQLHTWFNV